MALDKYHLNLAAIGPSRQTAVVEVKASNSQRFVTGFYQKYKVETQEHPDFWVLYRLAVDGDEDFYVLTHQEMAIAQRARNYPDEQHSWMQQAERVIRGVDNVLGRDIEEHRSAWHKILQWCTA
jgi:hypothetical protein